VNFMYIAYIMVFCDMMPYSLVDRWPEDGEMLVPFCQTAQDHILEDTTI
jgi:hypothetical protein